MDQSKLCIPNLIRIAKSYSNARTLHTHHTGVLNHGGQPSSYFDLKQYPIDANLTINILLLELAKLEFIPDILFLQMVNCWKENKNQFVIGFLAILVKLNILKQVSFFFFLLFSSKCFLGVYLTFLQSKFRKPPGI